MQETFFENINCTRGCTVEVLPKNGYWLVNYTWFTSFVEFSEQFRVTSKKEILERLKDFIPVNCWDDFVDFVNEA